ncbi:MAG TPA: hypothetical protein DCZ13_15625 [Porticoccaceae bacterium]|nr:hypothetical protein [Porticoccaceae bacterium]
MADNPYIGQCLLRCEQATLLIREAAKTRQRGLSAAFLNGAVFHLVSAYRYHLRAIAKGSGLQHPQEIIDIEQLLEELGDAATCTAEVQEILNLNAQPESWLNQCVAAHEQLINGVLPTVADSQLGDIPLRREDSMSPKRLTVELVGGWNHEMSAMQRRHLETMHEY